jgi:cysteine-rich repeat protein
MNKINGDGCSANCTIESGWQCQKSGSNSTPDYCFEICGDGKRFTTNSSICDDGNNITGDGCSDYCFVEYGYKCSGGSKTSKDTCVEICGDSINFGTLQCEDFNLNNSDGCSSNCTIEPGWQCSKSSNSSMKDTCTEICGDGKRFKNTTGLCDDGNNVTNDGCNA